MRERKIEKYLIKSPKQMIMVIAVFTLMIFVGGTTYAFFNYTRTGNANTLRTGRIYFSTEQTNNNTINLTNIFPIDPTDNTQMNDTTKVGTLEIEIEGDTDYDQGVEYLVSSTNTHITTSTGKLVPISLDVTVINLGTSNPNYFTARESKDTTIYKKLVGDTLVGDQMLLVGYIKPNTTRGTIEGVNGKLTIKAYLDENKILISDTYDGTESDNMGTPNSLAQGKTVLTTTEWNALSSSGVSFQIKVEANEGIWVNNTLDNIMRTKNLNTTTNQPIMDNVSSEFVSASTGINFGAVSSSTNGQGIYMRAGTENDAYPIVYYRGAVEDNNVVFNNKCWKAVRTTDTGGVKLIYSGEQITVRSREFTDPDTYASENAGDMFTFDSTDNTWNYEVSDGTNREISFKVPAGDNYNIVITGTTGSTCGGGIGVYKDGVQVNGTSQGGGNPINYSYSYGTLTASNVIKMVISGSSTSSSCGITVKMSMQQNTTKLTKNDYTVLMEKDTGELGCGNTGESTHINILGTNKFAFNTNSNSPAYVGYMYGTVYPYSTSNWTSGAKFGSSFTWDGTNYKLVDATVTTPDATHHYSCNSTDADATCTDLRYVYYTYNNNATKYYITLTGGDGVEETLIKMNTNTNNSNAKTQIDTWYASNMNTVTSKLEDTVWCNDRSIGKANGWSATGSWGTDYKDNSILYGAYERSNYASSASTVKNGPSLICANRNDAFTVSNGNGNQKLTYPVALLTEDEMVLAGGLGGSPSQFYLNNGSTYYWSLSPSDFNYTGASGFYVINGSIDDRDVDVTGGLRPSVSLKPGMPVVSGDGTSTSPYVILN